jgi:hypothetical protein
VKRILRDLPFFENSQLFLRDPPALNRFVPINHHQIPVRVSLRVYLPGSKSYAPTVPSLPAILDTGFNGDLALSRFHLEEWAAVSSVALGLEIRPSVRDRPITVKGIAARVFDGSFYIRPNRPGTWAAIAESPLEVAASILVLEASQDEFRLPLLGMSALNRLGRKLTIDYRRRLVQL